MIRTSRFWALTVLLVSCLVLVASGIPGVAADASQYEGDWLLTMTGADSQAVNYKMSVRNSIVTGVVEVMTGKSLSDVAGSVYESTDSGATLTHVDWSSTPNSYLMTGKRNASTSTSFTIEGTYSGSVKSAEGSTEFSGTFVMVLQGWVPPNNATPTTDATPPNDMTPPTVSYPSPEPTPLMFPTPTPNVNPTPTDNGQPIQIRLVQGSQTITSVNLGETFGVELKVQLPSGSSGGLTPGTPSDPYGSIYSKNMGWEFFFVIDSFGNVQISDKKAPILRHWAAETFDWMPFTQIAVPDNPLYVGEYQIRGWIVPADASIDNQTPSVADLTIQGNSSTSGGNPTPQPTPPDNTPQTPKPQETPQTPPPTNEPPTPPPPTPAPEPLYEPAPSNEPAPNGPVTYGEYTFNTDSSTLTNLYFPLKVGDVWTYECKTPLVGNRIDFKATREETVFGVKCLVTESIAYGPNGEKNYDFSEWIAQDTFGNIHVFRQHISNQKEDILYVNNANMIGLGILVPAVDKMQENYSWNEGFAVSAGARGTIIGLNATSEVGKIPGLLLIKEIEHQEGGSGWTIRTYYQKNVGIVEEIFIEPDGKEGAWVRTSSTVQ